MESSVQEYEFTATDRERASKAEMHEVPQLSADEMVCAQKYGFSEERFARELLANKYGEERWREKARLIAKRLEIVLSQLIPNTKLFFSFSPGVGPHHLVVGSRPIPIQRHELLNETPEELDRLCRRIADEVRA
ncbi:MAG: hypothetical protein WCE73_02890 [Candidatus Angelobacter sp.]